VRRRILRLTPAIKISSLVNFLFNISRLAFKIRQSRVARMAGLMALGLCFIAISLARPGNDEPKAILNVSIRQVSATTLNQFVRVTGVLDVAHPYQTKFDLGPITLRGSRYFRMAEPGSPDAIWVADESLPADALSSAAITLVGEMVEGAGQQPGMYLQVGQPPNTRLINTLARVGMALGALIALAFLAMALMERAHFAFSVSLAPSANPAAPELLWFGEVGRTRAGPVVREAPARLSAIRHEAIIEGAGDPPAWQTPIHRLTEARLCAIATRFGALPAARLTYQDAAGLTRRAALAANSPAALNTALEVLRHVGM